MPSISLFMSQLNVCGNEDATSSVMMIAEKLSYETVFIQQRYPNSTDCTGQKDDMATGAEWNRHVIAWANSSQICVPTGLSDPSVAFFSIVQVRLLSYVKGWSTFPLGVQYACTTSCEEFQSLTILSLLMVFYYSSAYHYWYVYRLRYLSLQQRDRL